jgi:hypothetical protein
VKVLASALLGKALVLKLVENGLGTSKVTQAALMRGYSQQHTYALCMAPCYGFLLRHRYWMARPGLGVVGSSVACLD